MIELPSIELAAIYPEIGVLLLAFLVLAVDFVVPANKKSTSQTTQILFEIVSTLTGFPVDMLELDMNIESDLGIDSIKKVEIISELENRYQDVRV